MHPPATVHSISAQTIQKEIECTKTKQHRVTSLEQLSIAEFIGELARPKVYENSHKKLLGVWFDLVMKIKYVAQFWFSKLFFYVKNPLNLYDFFFIENTKMGN